MWWDGEIKPSQQWREEIEAALDSARVAVLLVSKHFLASDFIVNIELPYFIDAARQRHVQILWASSPRASTNRRLCSTSRRSMMSGVRSALCAGRREMVL